MQRGCCVYLATRDWFQEARPHLLWCTFFSVDPPQPSCGEKKRELKKKKKKQKAEGDSLQGPQHLHDHLVFFVCNINLTLEIIQDVGEFKFVLRFRGAVVVTSALHAEGPGIEPQRNQFHFNFHTFFCKPPRPSLSLSLFLPSTMRNGGVTTTTRTLQVATTITNINSSGIPEVACHDEHAQEVHRVLVVVLLLSSYTLVELVEPLLVGCALLAQHRCHAHGRHEKRAFIVTQRSSIYVGRVWRRKSMIRVEYTKWTWWTLCGLPSVYPALMCACFLAHLLILTAARIELGSLLSKPSKPVDCLQKLCAG